MSADDAGIEANQLRSLIDRIDRLEAQKETITNDDIAEALAEAHANGFDARIVEELVRMRKDNPDGRTYTGRLIGLLELYDRAISLHTYKKVLGIHTPSLFDAAIAKAKGGGA